MRIIYHNVTRRVNARLRAGRKEKEMENLEGHSEPITWRQWLARYTKADKLGKASMIARYKHMTYGQYQIAKNRGEIHEGAIIRSVQAKITHNQPFDL